MINDTLRTTNFRKEKSIEIIRKVLTEGQKTTKEIKINLAVLRLSFQGKPFPNKIYYFIIISNATKFLPFISKLVKSI